MGLGGFTAGYVHSITIDPQWWLSALFIGLGTAVGETLVPVVRMFIGEDRPWSERWYTVVAVVTAAAMLASPVLVPIGRWCMKVQKTDWTKVKAPNERRRQEVRAEALPACAVRSSLPVASSIRRQPSADAAERAGSAAVGTVTTL